LHYTFEGKKGKMSANIFHFHSTMSLWKIKKDTHYNLNARLELERAVQKEKGEKSQKQKTKEAKVQFFEITIIFSLKFG